MNVRLIKAIGSVIVLLMAAEAAATVINVPSQYATIQAGIDAGNQGDTVLVAPGLYVENVIIDTSSIVLASQYLLTHNESYIDSTIIDGDSLNTVVKFAFCDSAAMLVGFTIRRGYSSSGYGGGVDCTLASPTITNNYIKNNFGGGISCWYGHAVIKDNIIIRNSAIYTGGGISCVFRGSIRIQNNLIAYNSAGNSGGGIRINHGLGDNTVVTAINTIVWQNSAANGRQIHVTAPSIASISYCDVQDGWEGDGNIDSDPLFCNPADTIFELAANSPCVGTGYNGANIGVYGVGCEAVGITDEDIGLPGVFDLLQNYPNPFNAQTTIRFILPQAGSVEIDIYDILGRKIETAFAGHLPAGENHIVWDADKLPSGAYSYKVNSGDFTQTKRMTLLK
ncbi:MAG: hypothetical protein A2W25_13665 [candidate division Zixibacteria bacterium RBG_16_53_22]|nr:MAG: hypothetical protein A2W25_13665 [candidate division Zixibacteria bacterium RBG_16_53_22]